MVSTAQELPESPPHPELRAYYQGHEQQRRFLTRLFDEGAPYYETIIRWMSFGSGDWYRQEALHKLGVCEGARVLDIATGTGPVARAAGRLVGSTGRVLGIDPSRGMLAAGDHGSAYLSQGLAEALPVRDAAFDFVSMGYALRHVPSLERAFAEYHRALRPDGRLLLLEISRPKSTLGRKLFAAQFGVLVPWLTRLMTRSRPAAVMMRYYWETMDQCVDTKVILEALLKVGFIDVKHQQPYPLMSEYVARRP